MALSQLNRILDIDAPSARVWRPYAHSRRAFCFLKLKRYWDCIKEADKALELDPELSEAYRDRAAAKKALGHDDEAAADARHAEFLLRKKFVAKM